MKATLLVEIDINDPSELPSIAADMLTELNASGFDVTDVKPWQRTGSVAPIATDDLPDNF